MNKTTAMIWEEAVIWLKSQPDRLDLIRACYYDDPLLDAARRFHVSPEWRAVQKLLAGKSGKALDIGAGRGISSYALATDGWTVSALEPDSSSVVGAGAIRQLGTEAGLSIKVVEEWGERLPFADGKFDLVYCRAVLHHARNLDDLCAEAARVLRPGGVFLATREHVLSKTTDLNAFLKSHALHALYGGEHAYLLSDYVSAIEKAGLRITRQFNPIASDINLHPLSQEQIKINLAKKLRFPFPSIIPDFVLYLKGTRSSHPGRLYSFIAEKV